MSKEKFEIGEKVLVPCSYSGKLKKECTITHINEERGRICVKDKRGFGSCWDISQVTHFNPV